MVYPQVLTETELASRSCLDWLRAPSLQFRIHQWTPNHSSDFTASPPLFLSPFLQCPHPLAAPHSDKAFTVLCLSHPLPSNNTLKREIRGLYCCSPEGGHADWLPVLCEPFKFRMLCGRYTCCHPGSLPVVVWNLVYCLLVTYLATYGHSLLSNPRC